MTLTKEQYATLINWVENNFVPIKTINYNMSAYTIHGIFERLYDKGFYVDEHAIIQAMRKCGYDFKYNEEGQCYFNISQKSQAIQIFHASLGVQPKDYKPEWF